MSGIPPPGQVEAFRDIVTIADGASNNLAGVDSSGRQLVAASTRSAVVTLNPAVTAAAYAAKNCVGGKLNFANVFGTALSGVLNTVTLSFKPSTITAGFELFLFNADPSNTTWTDKVSPTINAADVAKLLGAPIPLTAYNNDLGNTVYGIDGIGRPIASATTSLFAVLLTTGTPTFASTSDVFITVHVLQD